MNRTERIWSHAHAAFAKADEAFAEADKAFNAAFGRADESFTEETDSGPIHHLRFKARNGSERWRIFIKFIKLGFAVLFNGKVILQFKDRR